MIASFLTEHKQPQPLVHAVFYVAREMLSVKAQGYCTTRGDAGDGTFQIPEWVFDGRPTVKLIDVVWRVCPQCASVVKALREPPR